MNKLIIQIFALLLFLVCNAYSSTKLIDEDFEDVEDVCFTIPTAATSLATHADTGSLRFARVFHDQCVNSCSNCSYDSYPSSYDGDRPRIVTGSECPDSGTCIRGYINGSEINGYPFEEPKVVINNFLSGSKTVYIKFDIKIASNLGTSYSTRECSNVKIFRITSHTTADTDSNDHWHPQANLVPSSSSYSWYSWDCNDDCTPVGEYGEYYMYEATTTDANHLMDNQWHTLEFYVDIGSYVAEDRYDENADGIWRMWEDGELIIEDIHVPMRETNVTLTQGLYSIAIFRHWKEYAAPVTPAQGNVYLDNIEVWDGMPEAAPEVSSASINGTTAQIVFDQDLDNTALANLINGDLVFTGTTTGASDLESCSENPAGTLNCTADATFVTNETVTLSSSGLTGDELCDDSENCISSISGESVTNNTPAAGGTINCSGAYNVNGGTATYNANGGTIGMSE